MVAVIRIIAGICIFSLSSICFATYGSMLCKNNPDVSCHVVRGGESWNSLFPNDEQRDLVMRLNRMNIRLHPGMVIAIPKNFNGLDKMRIAPFAKQINASGRKLILVSLEQLAWGAYDEQGVLQNWGPVSGARGYCPDIGQGCHTPHGYFTIYEKEGPGCVSSKFPVGEGGAPMPYCMFFHGGFALHGSYEVPGYNASHGCVRMYPDDAKWLNQEFTEGSRVDVKIQ